MLVGLPEGDMHSDVPFVSRRDEIGKMAASVEVFKKSMLDVEGLRGEGSAPARSV